MSEFEVSRLVASGEKTRPQGTGIGQKLFLKIRQAAPGEGGFMLILGLILLILGFVLNIGILWTIGIILLVVGAVFWLLGATGRAVAGRRYWY